MNQKSSVLSQAALVPSALMPDKRCKIEQNILVFDEADGGDIHDHIPFSIEPSCDTRDGQLCRISWR